MKTLIKICGISEPELARETLKAGADLVGIILTSVSKRYVDLKKAIEISKAVYEMNSKPVLIFKNESFEMIKDIANQIGDCIIQFQGEFRKDIKELTGKFETIIAFSYASAFLVDYGAKERLIHPTILQTKKSILLADNTSPGSGKEFCWENFKPPASPWILAGGLNAKNVREAIVKLAPFGVDVSSGVEDEEGKKDLRKIKDFIDEVKRSYIL